MTVKKESERQAIPIDPIDPAVENALGSPSGFYTQLARLKKLTPAQRKKAERDRKRSKETYDLPEWIGGAISTLARHYDVPKSNVVAHLIAAGLRTFLEGQINFGWLLNSSRSPRFLSTLNPPDEIDRGDIERRLMEFDHSSEN